MRIGVVFCLPVLLVVLIGGGLLAWYGWKGGQPASMTGADKPNGTAKSGAIEQVPDAATNNSDTFLPNPQLLGPARTASQWSASARTVASNAANVTESVAVLDGLLADLQNSDPITRAHALGEIKQLDPVMAVPRLKAFAETTDNPRTKSDILDAIEFLELPSYVPGTPHSNTSRVHAARSPFRKIRKPKHVPSESPPPDASPATE